VTERAGNDAGGPEISLRVAAVAAAGLALALCLPFAGKAFHIDDPAFLNLSGMIGWNPLHAIPVDYDFGGGVIPQLLPYEITHPLLVPYFIKIVRAVFGEGEIALHVAFLVFPVIALVSLIVLSAALFPATNRLRLVLVAFFATLPAFLVNAQNVMTDVPAVAFLLLAMAGFVRGIEQDARRMLWLGSAALTLAIFTSYQMGIFVPLVLLYALARRRATAQTVVAALLPLVVLAAWLVAVYALYDIFPVLKSKLSDSQASIGGELRKGLTLLLTLHRGVSVLAFAGASLLWVLPLHYALQGRLLRAGLLRYLPLLAISYPLTLAVVRYPLGAQLGLAAFVAAGLLALVTLVETAVAGARRRGESAREVFLLAWIGGVVGYCVFLLPFSAARYPLPAYPAVLILLFSDPAWNVATRGRRMAVLFLLCGSAVMALLSAYSDYRYAETYRAFSQSVAELRATRPAGSNVWYVGEWGMHYYMERAGARYLHADSTAPARGDLVVIPEMPRFWAPAPQVRSRLAPAGRRRYVSPLPLRLFNARSPAGFYAQFIGMLPFAFSDQPDEVFQIYEVAR
jgi:4-amino-4-deoxy-L-arabinose transferase-like glycosyltransferase